MDCKAQASSGSINFITARPTDAPEAYAEISYGRFDRWDVQAAASGKLGMKLFEIVPDSITARMARSCSRRVAIGNGAAGKLRT